MLARSDFSYFHGMVMQVTHREKVSTTTRGGGGFVYNGTGFIAPPSVAVHSTSVQEFWLKNPEREQQFSIYGSDLPMREGQEVTALWLKNRLIAYVNHATGQFLLFRQDVNRLNKSKPMSVFFYILIPIVIAFALLQVDYVQMKASLGHPIREAFWQTVCPFILASLLIAPGIGLCVGLIKKWRYRRRQSAITTLVETELNLLLSRKP